MTTLRRIDYLLCLYIYCIYIQLDDVMCFDLYTFDDAEKIIIKTTKKESMRLIIVFCYFHSLLYYVYDTI